jgi:hypothetical protein
MKLTIKGHEFEAVLCKDSHSRRAIQYKNKILFALHKLGLTEDDVDVPLEPLAIKKTQAKATWYFDNNHMHYSYNGLKFVDNLYVVMRVIELEIQSLIDEKKTINDFILEFKEDKDVEEKRKEARKILGVEHDTKDFELITKKFKELAKEHHPDKNGGDTQKFKTINHAHKILKRELF